MLTLPEAILVGTLTVTIILFPKANGIGDALGRTIEKIEATIKKK